MSDESINPSTTSDNFLAPALHYFGHKTRVKFHGSCLKLDKITLTYGKIVSIYTAYEIYL